jgi:hypothetical protein
VVAGNGSIEASAFKSASTHSDASDAFVHSAYEGLLGPKAGLGVTPEYVNTVGQARPADMPAAPAGVDAGSWAQISQMIGDGKNVNFSTASDNANSKVQPDFILGSDGKLRANPAKTTPPSPDGKINIQVGDAQSNQQAAKAAAQQLKVAGVNEKIAYWQHAHPNDKNIPGFLQGELYGAQTAASDSGSGLQRVDDQAVNNLKFPDGQGGVEISNPEAPAPNAAEQPVNTGGGPRGASPGGSPGGGGYEGGSPGGGGGRPGSDYHGLDNPGPAPSRDYSNGEFNPSPSQPDTTPMPQKVAGDMSIVLDKEKGPSCTPDQIQKFLEDHHSPAATEVVDGKPFSQNLYDTCIQHNLDPGAAVGFFLQESTLGEHGRAVHNHSLGNIKGHDPESGGTDGTFRHYESWTAGAKDWANLIDNNYVHGRHAETLSQILQVYAPSSDGNNVANYIGTVKGVMTAFREQKENTSTSKAATA